MSVAILIPYGGSDPYRETALASIRAIIEPHWRRIVCLDHWEPFSRARAINKGARIAGDVDILVCNDADSAVPPAQIREAIRLAEEAPGIVYAFTTYTRLDEHNEIDVRFEYAGSQGCIALRRECFEQAGGYDPRFEAWGYEDLAFGQVCEAFWPARRVEGNLYHLWHPPRDQRPADQEQIAANLALYERYAAAAGDADALMAIRREAGDV